MKTSNILNLNTLFHLIQVGVIFWVIGLGNISNPLPINQPKFLDYNINLENVTTSKYAFDIDGLDSLKKYKLYLLNDPEGNPISYYANILTPVCIDEICKPLYIELYWNLLGAYAGYGIYPDKKLSKYDHELFEEQDYQKLHKLLRDQFSKLERKELADLYDPGQSREKAIQYNGVEVDAITGATVKEIKESVIEGALYSCYTLWHMVHGLNEHKIKKNISSIYDTSLRQSFLQSPISSYHLYAIKQFDETDFKRYVTYLPGVLEMASPLDRGWVLKKLPKSLFSDSFFVNNVYNQFSKFDRNTKTLLVKNIEFSNLNAKEYLSSQIDHMTKNQVIEFLTAIDKRDNKVFENLINYSNGPNSQFDYLINEFLSQNQK